MSGESEPRVVGPGFHDEVFLVVARVPEGRVSTYGDIARVLGSVRVARHVGWALAATPVHGPDGRPVAWHRVVKSDGRIAFPGSDSRGREQRERLASEGVVIDDRGRVADFRQRRTPIDQLEG